MSQNPPDRESSLGHGHLIDGTSAAAAVSLTLAMVIGLGVPLAVVVLSLL